MPAQLKQLLPPTANVKDSTGWVTDDMILLSLSLSAILKRNLKSITTPLMFQSMLLNCVPRAEASANFVQSFRVFIPTLDSDRVKDLLGFAQPQLLKQSSSSVPGKKLDSILQHPHLQHRSALSLRSFDVLEWLEMAEQQLEAACSFELAEIPRLSLIKEQNLNSVLHHLSAKEQWTHRIRRSFQSTRSITILGDEVDFLKNFSNSEKMDLNNQHKTTDEKESFDPLQLLFQMTSQQGKEAAQALAYDEKVTFSYQALLFLIA